MPAALILDSVGAGEWLVLLAVVLILCGPQRLPALARKIGRLLARLQQAADIFRLQLMSLEEEEPEAGGQERKEQDDGQPERPGGSRCLPPGERRP